MFISIFINAQITFKKISLILCFTLICLILKGQNGKIFGVYLDTVGSMVYFAYIDLNTGITTTIDSLPGVNTWYSGTSTFDYINGNYIIRTNLGITVVNSQNGNIINTFTVPPFNIGGFEYGAGTNKVFVVYIDSMVLYFAYIDLNTGITTTIDSLPGVYTWFLNTSTFDYINGNYIFKTNLGITVVNSQNGNIINNFPAPVFKILEFEYYDDMRCFINNIVISGQVSDNTGPTISGMVRLKAYSPNPNKMAVVDSTIVDSLGNYTFFSVPPGQYLVIAKADSLLYSNTVPTYYDTTNHWQKAIIIDISSCDTTIIANIQLIEFPTTIGFGKISGQVSQGGGLEKLLSSGVGNPLPGIDIMLEQYFNGSVVGYTITDSSGNYSFKNIPLGDYKLYVDITGLPMDSTYYLSVTSIDTIFTNLNFYVDSVSIGITVPTSIKHNVANNENLTILNQNHPNPSRDFTKIDYKLPDNERYGEILFYTVDGKEVKRYKVDNTFNTLLINNSDLPSGTYLYHLITPSNTTSAKKMLVIK